MLEFKPLGRTLLLGALCAASFGCTETQTTTTRTDPVTDPNVTVTANKPLIPDTQTSTTTVEVNRETGAVTVDRTNTGVNILDQSDSAKTPLDQNENKADNKVTTDIRSRVVDTKMSANAQNVKINTQDGKVTLQGPVQTADEKTQIEDIARDVAGKDNVDSQLEIAPN